MYLKKTPTRSGRVSLSIVHGYRDEKGRTRQRTMKTIGFLDELEKEYDDPVAHFTAVAKEMTREHREAAAPVSIEIHPAQKVDKRKACRKNAGAAVPLAVYNSLGVERALRNHAAGSRAGYDVNAVMRLLVMERILSPGSKLSALASKDRYFFRAGFSEDDLYRSLDVLAAARDKVIGAANRSIAKTYGRDTRNVFYDVTNYYFECGEDGLRKKGVSKEHRPNPIVQMGLLQDADGVPITYRLFPGNTSDCATMLPVLLDMKRDLGLPTVTAVADKGLNCSENMAALAASGNGFVFSQSIRGTKSAAALRRRVLDEEGYAANPEGTFKKKSWQGGKTVHLKAADTASGKPEDVELDVKYVAFWSEKYARRAKREREKAIQKACALISSPGSFTRATSRGAAQYVKNISFDEGTGEVASGRRLELDERAIAEAERCDGYYLIVTSRTEWTDDEVIGAYRGLWQIEESFKITKSDIEARPVYVWTPAHIEAHFLTCYVALVILRLLQKGCPSRPSAARIAGELKKLSCSALEGNWWLFDHRSDLTEELFCAVGLEHPTKYMTTGEIRRLMQKRPTGR